MSPASVRRRGGLWRHHDFRLLWIGETTSQVGSAVTSVAVPLVAVITLHADVFHVALLTAATWFPWLIIGLPVGAVVDRMGRRRLMVAADIGSLVLFASVPIAAWAGMLTIAQLFAVTLGAGACSVVFNSAFPAYLPSLVAVDDLTEANAKLSGSRAAAQVAGPGIGGAIAELAGPAAGLLLDAVSFAVSCACLIVIRSEEPQSDAAERRDSRIRDELTAGLRFILTDPFLRPGALFAALANLTFTGTEAVLVVFLVRTLGLTASAVGGVLALMGMGGIAGAVVVAPVSRRFGTARTMFACTMCGLPFALLVPLAERGPALIFLLLGEFVMSAAVVAANVIFGSFCQTYVPAHLLGRATASLGTVAYSCMPLGAVVAGALGAELGIRTALWILTAGIAASGLVLLTSPARRLRDLPQSVAESGRALPGPAS